MNLDKFPAWLKHLVLFLQTMGGFGLFAAAFLDASVLSLPAFGKLTMACLVLLASLAVSRAASGTWVNDASSNWGAASNWQAFVIADGIDATADFSTIDITVNRAVTLDTSRTIGNLTFADTNGAQYWLLNSSGGSALILATSAGTPTITTATNGANNYVAAISAPLRGTSGLNKAGNGILALGGTNTYTGPTTVSGGTLQITNGPGGLAGTGGLMNGSGGLVAYYSFNNVVGNRILNEGSGGALMDGMIVGNGGVSIGAGMGRFGDNCLNVTLGALHNNVNAANVGNGGYVLVNNPVVPFTESVRLADAAGPAGVADRIGIRRLHALSLTLWRPASPIQIFCADLRNLWIQEPACPHNPPHPASAAGPARPPTTAACTAWDPISNGCCPVTA